MSSLSGLSGLFKKRRHEVERRMCWGDPGEVEERMGKLEMIKILCMHV